MGQLDVQFFVPRHFRIRDAFAVLFHKFHVALHPLGLPLFQADIIDGKFLGAENVRGIQHAIAAVFHVHREGNILRHHGGKTVRRFVTGAADRHAVADQSVAAVKIFHYLTDLTVAPHGQPHQALKGIFPFRSLMRGLNHAHFGTVRIIFDHFFYIIFGNDLVAVQDDEIIIICPSLQIVIQIARFKARPVGTPHHRYARTLGEIVDAFQIFGLAAVV